MSFFFALPIYLFLQAAALHGPTVQYKESAGPMTQDQYEFYLKVAKHGK